MPAAEAAAREASLPRATREGPAARTLAATGARAASHSMARQLNGVPSSNPSSAGSVQADGQRKGIQLAGAGIAGLQFGIAPRPPEARSPRSARRPLRAPRGEIEPRFLTGWSPPRDEPGVGRAYAELLGQQQFVVGAFE